MMTKSLTGSGYSAGITLVAALGGLLFGYDTAVISGTVASLGTVFVDPLKLTEIAASTLLGFIVASALLGCIAGGAIAGILNNRLGRRGTLFVAAVLFFVSALGSAFPDFVLWFTGRQTGGELTAFLPEFVLSRIAGGLGVGIASVTSPMFIAEIAPSHIRGRLVSFNQFAIILGQLLVYSVNYLIALDRSQEWLDAVGWRYMFLSGALPALLFLFLLFLIPESPRWLVMNGCIRQARRVLIRLQGESGAENIITAMRESVSRPSGKQPSLRAFGTGVLIIGVLLSVFQQLTGINVVLYYAPEVFRQTGVSTGTALLQTAIVGSINLLFTVVAILCVDKLGRRPLQMLGAGGMSVAMLLLGFTFYFGLSSEVALGAMLLFVAMFALSWGPVCWVLLSEIFPNGIRTRALSLAVMMQWTANLVVSWTFPMMAENTFLQTHFHHAFPFWLYGIMSLIALVFVRKYVPETRGKTLEEIEQFWTVKAASRVPE